VFLFNYLKTKYPFSLECNEQMHFPKEPSLEKKRRSAARAAFNLKESNPFIEMRLFAR
jgi:hypothetical protein